MAGRDIQYVSNENGEPTGVLIPIELWREISSERETAYLVKSDTMKRRLMEASKREEGIPFEDVCDRLGI